MKRPNCTSVSFKAGARLFVMGWLMELTLEEGFFSSSMHFDGQKIQTRGPLTFHVRKTEITSLISLRKQDPRITLIQVY